MCIRDRSGGGVILAALLFGAAWSLTFRAGEFKIGPADGFDIFRLGSYFLSGSVLAVLWPHWRNHAVVIGAAGLAGIFITRNLLPVDTLLHSLALAAATIGLGSSRAMAWFSKGGDASYGMYVFAWPVQQFSQLLIGSFWLSMLAAFLVTAAIGYTTWHTFEQRAMAYPKRLAERLQRKRRDQAEVAARI